MPSNNSMYTEENESKNSKIHFEERKSVTRIAEGSILPDHKTQLSGSELRSCRDDYVKIGSQ